MSPQQIIANRLRQGRRHMLCEEFSQAVDVFQEAVELSVALYENELAPECGEPYYLYGSALLALARAESQVFDGAGGDDKGGEGQSDGEDIDDSDNEGITSHLSATSTSTTELSSKSDKGKGR